MGICGSHGSPGFGGDNDSSLRLSSDWLIAPIAHDSTPSHEIRLGQARRDVVSLSRDIDPET